MDHKEFSRRGGMARSAAKTRAARRNAKKPRGRWVTAVAYEFEYETGVMSGVLLFPGKLPMSDEKADRKIIAEVEKKTGKKVEQLLMCEVVSTLIK